MEYFVYVKVNANGYVTAIDSYASQVDEAGWVEVDRGYGRKYHFAQGYYFPDPLRTGGGAYRYKVINGKAAECSAEEIAVQEANFAASIQPPQSPYITWEELDSAYYEGVDSL